MKKRKKTRTRASRRGNPPRANGKQSPALAVRRDHKDILFKYILKDKKALLTLYNALNGTDHSNVENLEITTLEDVIYLSYKNDLSFIIGNTISLYEHQSTVNPNMPLRSLYYVSRLYGIYVRKNGDDQTLYSPTLVRIPYPQFVVFYSGKEFQEENKTLRLSDAYMEMPADVRAGKAAPSLELAVRFVNINYGNNEELLGKSRELEGYAIFVHKTREYRRKGMSNAEAISRAIDDCIEEDVLRDMFRIHKNDILYSLLCEFDQERYDKVLVKHGIEQGIEQGIAIGEERAAKEWRNAMAEKDALVAEKDALIESLQRQLAEAQK